MVGVDSMVLSKILKLLQKAGDIKIKDIVGIHIDYANRPESGREADYVKLWCHELLGISYKVRVINEVTRGKHRSSAWSQALLSCLCL